MGYCTFLDNHLALQYMRGNAKILKIGEKICRGWQTFCVARLLVDDQMQELQSSKLISIHSSIPISSPQPHFPPSFIALQYRSPILFCSEIRPTAPQKKAMGQLHMMSAAGEKVSMQTQLISGSVRCQASEGVRPNEDLWTSPMYMPTKQCEARRHVARLVHFS